jgi:hypothetical protein
MGLTTLGRDVWRRSLVPFVAQSMLCIIRTSEQKRRNELGTVWYGLYKSRRTTPDEICMTKFYVAGASSRGSIQMASAPRLCDVKQLPRRGDNHSTAVEAPQGHDAIVCSTAVPRPTIHTTAEKESDQSTGS